MRSSCACSDGGEGGNASSIGRKVLLQLLVGDDVVGDRGQQEEDREDEEGVAKIKN